MIQRICVWIVISSMLITYPRQSALVLLCAASRDGKKKLNNSQIGHTYCLKWCLTFSVKTLHYPRKFFLMVAQYVKIWINWTFFFLEVRLNTEKRSCKIYKAKKIGKTKLFRKKKIFLIFFQMIIKYLKSLFSFF